MRRRRRKGEDALWALQYLESGHYTASDLIQALLTSPHGSFEYHARRIHRAKIREERLRGIERKKAAARFYALCSRLRKEGLVSEENGAKTMQLTLRGRLKMRALVAQVEEGALPDSGAYLPSKSDQLIVIAFDIPEDERPKRD